MARVSPESTNERVAYLVGGLRISLRRDSKTAGPRTHILGFVNALENLGVNCTVYVASSFPGLRRFSHRDGAVFASVPKRKMIVGDVVRLAALVWTGINIAWRERSHRYDTAFIYERSAVFQSLSSFHPAKGRAIRVLEANAVLTRETAHDRKAIALEWLAAAIERHALRRADLIIAVSAAVKRDVIEFSGVAEDKVVVISNGVSTTLTNVATDAVDRQLIGFAGSVGRWQSLDKVLEVLVAIEGARLEIIGDGADRVRLEALAKRLNLDDRVTFVGQVPHEEALKRMTRWAVGYAGHSKTWAAEMYHSPLKLYEYAALGMHIVCTPSSDAEQLRADGINLHTFVDHADLPTAVADALHSAALDEAQARDEQRQAVRDNHTWDARASEFLQVVQRLRSQRDPAG